jgi:hypothetical protein
MVGSQTWLMIILCFTMGFTSTSSGVVIFEDALGDLRYKGCQADTSFQPSMRPQCFNSWGTILDELGSRKRPFVIQHRKHHILPCDYIMRFEVP